MGPPENHGGQKGTHLEVTGAFRSLVIIVIHLIIGFLTQ